MVCLAGAGSAVHGMVAVVWRVALGAWGAVVGVPLAEMEEVAVPPATAVAGAAGRTAKKPGGLRPPEPLASLRTPPRLHLGPWCSTSPWLLLRKFKLNYHSSQKQYYLLCIHTVVIELVSLNSNQVSSSGSSHSEGSSLSFFRM